MFNLPIINSFEPFPLSVTLDTALCMSSGRKTFPATQTCFRKKEDQLLIRSSYIEGRLRQECEKLAKALQWPVCSSVHAHTLCPHREGLSEYEEREFWRSDYNLSLGFDEGELTIAQKKRSHHCLICQMFGNDSLPSRLLVDDLVCHRPPATVTEMLGVERSKNRRFLDFSPHNIPFFRFKPPTLKGKLCFEGHLHFLPAFPPLGKPLIFAALQNMNVVGGNHAKDMEWLQWEFDIPEIAPETWSELLPQ